MVADLVSPAKARPGDRVAVLSPSFAAPGVAPAVHEQAMHRLTDLTGLVPVEYPTTRLVGADPGARAADLNAAFADPDIRAVLATIGGEDQITVVPHLRRRPRARRPQAVPRLQRQHQHPVAGCGPRAWPASTAGRRRCSSGPGPAVDACHLASLRAALLTGERLEVVEPGESEDFGIDWGDPRSLTEYGEREPTEPWAWAGPTRAVTGRTWGGCLEVLQWVLTAGRFPSDPAVLDGGVLLLETDEDLIPSREVGLGGAQPRRARPARGGRRGARRAAAGVELRAPRVRPRSGRRTGPRSATP